MTFEQRGSPIETVPNPGIQRGDWTIEPKKLVISLVLGLGGFAGSFFTLSFGFPPFFISINWSDALPLLAALAFGGRYGFIACTVGLGALYPFFLWPNNGWACLVTTVLLVAWTTANGYFMGLRNRTPTKWNRPAVVYSLSVAAFGVLPLVLFPFAMMFNPPFWYPHAELSMPADVLFGIQIKGTIVFAVLIVFDDLLLRLPLVRKIFGLTVSPQSRKNGKLALRVFAASLLVWIMSIFLDRALITHTFPGGLFRIEDPYEAISLLVFLAGGVFIASLALHYEETRLKSEDEVVANQSRMQLAAGAADIGIWEWDIDAGTLNWDAKMHDLYGTDAARFGSTYEAWIETVHPDDRDAVKAEIQTGLQGTRSFEMEFRIRKPEGRTSYIKAVSQPVHDESRRLRRMIGVNIDITERKEHEERTRRSLIEKETLIRELYHRTKNTLQVTRGLVMLQADRSPENIEVQELAKSTETRIHAISLVHEMLYSGRDLSRLAIDQYVRNLADRVFEVSGATKDRIALRCDIENRFFLLDTAVPLGLILNELLTNSLKYAFPGGRSGTISVSLAANADGREVLSYADDGVGVPDGFDFRSQDSLGLKLIFSIAEHQMRGSVSMRASGGVSCVVEFPADLYQARV